MSLVLNGTLDPPEFVLQGHRWVRNLIRSNLNGAVSVIIQLTGESINLAGFDSQFGGAEDGGEDLDGGHT